MIFLTFHGTFSQWSLVSRRYLVERGNQLTNTQSTPNMCTSISSISLTSPPSHTARERSYTILWRTYVVWCKWKCESSSSSHLIIVSVDVPAFFAHIFVNKSLLVRSSRLTHANLLKCGFWMKLNLAGQNQVKNHQNFAFNEINVHGCRMNVSSSGRKRKMKNWNLFDEFFCLCYPPFMLVSYCL